jgi:hypothetical protein
LVEVRKVAASRELVCERCRRQIAGTLDVLETDRKGGQFDLLVRRSHQPCRYRRRVPFT